MEASPEKKILSGTLGPKLRQERQRHHLSQEKLAEMVGCDVRSIRRWEQGKGIPDYENRHRLSKALDITLEHFHQLLQPVEEKDDKPLEGEVLDITLEDFHQFLSPVEERDNKSLESDIQVPESLPGSNHSISVSSEAQAKHLVQHKQRRALLKWGGIGLAATLAGGSGLFYWFSRLSSSSRPLLSSAEVYRFSTRAGAGIRDVEWSPQHNFIACVDEENVAQVITVISNTNSPSQPDAGNTNSLTPTIPPYSYNSTKVDAAVNCVTWSPDENSLASPSITPNMIHIWSPQNEGDIHFSYAPVIPPQSIAWSNDGQSIAVCGADGMVGTWSVATRRLQRMYPGHIGTVWRVSWSFDSIYLATAGEDGTVRIWNTTTEDPPLIYTGHRQAVFDVKWPSFLDTSIVSASEDKTVQIWNPMTTELVNTYKGHNASVRAAEWSPDGSLIASAGVDTTIHVWDASTGKTYMTYPGHTSTIWALSWSAPYGMNLASASEDGTMRVWNVNISR